MKRIYYGELPDGYSIKTFAIRERLVRDDKFIAQNVARLHPETQKPGADKGAANVVESVRHLLVEVDGVAVNTSSEPYMGLEDWTDATFTAVIRAWADAFRPEEDSEGKLVAVAKGGVRMA